MRMRYLLCMILSFAALSGCESNLFEDLAKTDTREAKLEEARIAIDDGNYNNAISILSESCGFDPKKPTVPPGGLTKCDKETQALLSSALMGAAGLDVIKLLDLASDLAKNPSKTATLDFTTVSQLLPTQSSESITDMYAAVTLLSDISPKTADDNLQLAMASASAAVLTVGAISCPPGVPPGDPQCGYDPTTGLPNRDYKTNPLTEAELNKPASSIGVPTNSTVGGLLITSTTTIGDAAGAAVETGANAAVGTNTALGVSSTDITKQIDDIEKTMDKDGNKKIDNKEMADYINKNLVK